MLGMNGSDDEAAEVPAPHEEEADRRVREAGALGQRIALLTAVLATISAIISYRSASTQSDAMFLKNESILLQAKASDAWSFYQARSVKSHIDESTALVASDPAVRARFLAAKAHEDEGRADLRAQAQQLQAESGRLSAEAEGKMKPHHELALAQTLIQVAIAVAAITALSRRPWLLWASLASALIGVLTAAKTLLA